MSNDAYLQVTRNEESLLNLLSARSSLIARGRRDAALLAVPCSKCGEPKELVFAGCVCASCSDTFDRQWEGSTTTDWVLVAFSGPEPSEIEPGFGSRFNFLQCMGEAVEEGNISREQLEWANVHHPWWPLVYVYTRTTFTQMKSQWAKCGPPEPLCIGPLTIKEFGQHFAEFAETLAENGDEVVYPNPWPKGRNTARGVPYVRPATKREIDSRRPAK